MCFMQTTQHYDKKSSLKKCCKMFPIPEVLIVSIFILGTPTWTVVADAVVAAVNNPAKAVMEEEEVGVTNTLPDPAIGPARNAKPTTL